MKVRITDIARELRYALDPVAFAVERLAFEPDPWQAAVMQSDRDALLNCSRQSGKSTATAALGLHRAIYRPGSLVLLVSKAERQSQELFLKLSDFLKLLDTAPVLLEDNKLRLTFENGSRVLALPGQADTVRGFSRAALVIEDEAAFVDDALYAAIRPMLAVSRGRLILLSTPNGRRGHFFDAWHDADADWLKVEVPATDCPRITPEFLERERRALGDRWFRQEYCCEFIETLDQVFRHEDIMRATTDDVAPLFKPGHETDDVQPLFDEVA